MSIVSEARQRLMGGRTIGRRAEQLGARPEPRVLDKRQLRQWVRSGYLVLPRFFSEERMKLLTKEIDHLWDERTTDDRGLGIDAFIDTPDERRIPFGQAPDAARQVPYKLNDVYLVSDLVQEAVLDPGLVAVVADLVDGTPTVCNSLTFERGSQQRFHFDTFYMPPLVPNKMLATWIALEDVDAKAGPLRYYPKSHLIPPYTFSHGGLAAVAGEMDDFDRYIEPEIRARNLVPTTFTARRGDVFIWHAQLYHGGAPIDDMSLTRGSLVTHYLRVEDNDPTCCIDIGGGRYYVRRPHQLPS